MIENYEKAGNSGMYASHGPVLLFALAHQIRLGHIDMHRGLAEAQINVFLEGVRKKKNGVRFW